MQFVLVLLVAIAAWQVDMAVECAGRCVRRPKAVKVDKPHTTVPQPPQCRGPQCQTPKPLPVQPSSTR
jgi:hypothetical protein